MYVSLQMTDKEYVVNEIFFKQQVKELSERLLIHEVFLRNVEGNLWERKNKFGALTACSKKSRIFSPQIKKKKNSALDFKKIKLKKKKKRKKTALKLTWICPVCVRKTVQMWLDLFYVLQKYQYN